MAGLTDVRLGRGVLDRACRGADVTLRSAQMDKDGCIGFVLRLVHADRVKFCYAGGRLLCSYKVQQGCVHGCRRGGRVDCAQGYEIQLVPMMMDGVSSMVQCFEFVLELLQKAQECQQLFAVVLISYLVRRYPDHPQSLVAAKQVVEHVQFLWSRPTSTSDILKEMLEPVVWCAISFPSMAVEVTALLQDCLKVDTIREQSRSTSDHALHDAAVSAFRLFIQKKVLPGRVFS